MWFKYINMQFEYIKILKDKKNILEVYKIKRDIKNKRNIRRIFRQFFRKEKNFIIKIGLPSI